MARVDNSTARADNSTGRADNSTGRADKLHGPATTAEQILATFAQHGVRHIFFNPGTDTAPLQEAVMTLAARGAPCPNIITCTYESVALAAAHGYWQVTHEPQVVVVHVDVGTQNLGAMVHNAQRDHAGVVVLAGKTPYTEDGSRPGARSSVIHWQQDEPDQIGIVRGYVRWAQEITRPDVAVRAVGRAVQIARGAGPAYLVAAREILMEPAQTAPADWRAPFAAPSRPAADEAAIRAAAEKIARAQRPVVISSRAGRDPEAVAPLAELVDLLGARAFGPHDSLDISWRHPLFIRDAAAASAALGEADLVLVVDCVVPWIPKDSRPPEEATVIQIDPDPLRTDYPLWSFPVDVSIEAAPRLALPQLTRALADVAAGEPGLASRWSQRRERLASAAAPAAPPREADAPEGTPSVAEALTALGDVLGEDDLLLEEAVTNKAAVQAHVDRTLPGTLFSAGGPGLGWALGAAVGIKLASGDRRVVAVVGDGSFMFGQPLAALMLAAEARAPFLAVVLNNHGYRASRLPVFNLFPQGRSAAEGEAVATRFSGAPDFSVLAQAAGAHGERVSKRGELAGALRRGFAALADGRCAVIDITVDQS